MNKADDGPDAKVSETCSTLASVTLIAVGRQVYESLTARMRRSPAACSVNPGGVLRLFSIAT